MKIRRLYGCCDESCGHREWAASNLTSEWIGPLDPSKFATMNNRDKQLVIASKAADRFEKAQCGVRSCNRCSLVKATHRSVRFNTAPAQVKNSILHYHFWYPVSHVLVPTNVSQPDDLKQSVDKRVLIALLFRMEDSRAHDPDNDVGTYTFLFF